MFDWLRRWLRRIRCAIRRLSAPNEVSNAVSECIYGWASAYNITSNEGTCTITIIVRIKLDKDADVTAAELTALQTTWETGIETTWSNRFTLTRNSGECPCRSYNVVFDVQFVTSGQHHTVRVRRGPARSNMTTWDTSDTGGAASHEFGHMLGFPDEYADANCPSRTATTDGSIMQSNTGSVLRRHYEPFARWISNRLCCEYAVA